MKKESYKVLFVCLGNICRSPAAEEVMRMMVERCGWSGRIEVDSAGTYGGHAGDASDPRMRAAAARRGYALTHRARKVQESDFLHFDRIVAMDDMNYETLYRLAPSHKYSDRICRMASYLRHHPDWSHIPDPYYEGHEGFELVLDLLEDGCEALLDEIVREAD